ncbi:MAG: AMP-binding protein [Acidimicrobiales bacterium]
MSTLLGALVTGPDREAAVTVGNQRLSSAGLLAAATAVADRIGGARAAAVVASPSLDTIASVVGCLLAHVPVVPVPPDAGPLERNHILTDSGADVLCDVGAGGPAELSPVDGAPAPASGTAMVLYTSGTTGPPKGVQLSAAAMAFDLDALAEAWAWTADDTLVHGLPLFHAHGLVLGVLGALRVGSPLVHTLRPTPEAYVAAAGSLYFGVPTVWSRVCADEASASVLRSARLLVSGSAPLPGSVFARLTELTGSAPVERYGLTETLILTSTRAHGHRRQGSVGLPLGGVDIRLVSETGSALPADGRTIGELEVRTPAIFAGYLGRPGATAAAFRPDGWFRTGDVAVVEPDGNHRIVGRQSVDLIKSGGYRIGAGEVENALLGHPGVREAAVVGAPDPDLGQRIVAYVVVDAGLAGPELEDYVATRLSVHKRPRQVHVVDSLPRNAMGKVVKGQLLGDGLPAGGPSPRW